jgi:4-amino-4-deoxy-L-arabinose transferase-like glycosyltransferase
VVAVGALLRFGNLGQAQLFRDEAASWLLASYPIASLLQHNLDKTYPPLYEMVLRGWVLLFGTGEAALRSPSAIPGVVTLIAAWRWTGQALGRTAGLMAAAVVALSALLISNSREARMYSLETAFATVAWWLAWRLGADGGRIAQRPRWHGTLTAVFLAVAVAGEVWTMAFGLPAAALQLLFAVGCYVVQRRARGADSPSVRGPGLAVVAIVAGAASIAVWLPSLLTVPLSNQAFWTPKPDLGGLRDAFLNFLGVTGKADLSAVAAIVALVLVGVAMIGLAAPRRVGLLRRQPKDESSDAPLPDFDEDARRLRLFGLAALLGTSLAVVIWLYSQIEPVYDPRYLGAAAVPLAVLIAAGWAVVSKVRGGRVGAALLAVAILGPMTSGALLVVANLDADQGADPGREAAQELVPLVQPGDVVLSLDAQTYLPVAYYLNQTSAGSEANSEMYDWNPPNEPFYVGASLIPAGRVIDESLVTEVGWQSALPGLRPGGTIWLVTVVNGDQSNLGFAPLEDGELTQEGSYAVAGSDGTVGQIRALVLRADAAPASPFD